MKLPSVASVLATLLSATAITIGADRFEETLVIKLPRGPHGYRGMPGDIVQLKDGRLLMSYTGDQGIMAVKSLDRCRREFACRGKPGSHSGKRRCSASAAGMQTNLYPEHLDRVPSCRRDHDRVLIHARQGPKGKRVGQLAVPVRHGLVAAQFACDAVDRNSRRLAVRIPGRDLDRRLGPPAGRRRRPQRQGERKLRPAGG